MSYNILSPKDGQISFLKNAATMIMGCTSLAELKTLTERNQKMNTKEGSHKKRKDHPTPDKEGKDAKKPHTDSVDEDKEEKGSQKSSQKTKKKKTKRRKGKRKISSASETSDSSDSDTL
jgi:hypothetical protein